MSRQSHRRQAPWRRYVALTSVAIALLAVGFVITLGPADPPDEPTSVAAPTSVSLAAPTSIATPEDEEPAYPAGSLPAMLAMAPDRIDDDASGLPIEATYADLAAWFGIAGVDPATASDAELRSAMSALELPGVMQTRGLSDQWGDVYGFDVRAIRKILTVGHAPGQIVIMRGAFDSNELYDTWVRNGYQAVEVEETTIWSLFPGDRIDLTAPASRPALGLFNNVVVLEDGTFIAAARQSGMADVLRVINGDETSLLDRGTLVQAVMQWSSSGYPVSATLADGTILRVPLSGTGTPPDASEGTAVATPLANAPLPDVDQVLFGIVPCADGGIATQMRIVMMYEGTSDDLELVPSIVTARALATDEWSQRYQLESIEVVDADASLVEAVISRTDQAEPWSEMIEDRDLSPLHWSADA